MANLRNAPLLQVSFKAIWGNLPKGQTFPDYRVNGPEKFQLTFETEEVALFPGIFTLNLREKGYTTLKALGPLPNIMNPGRPFIRYNTFNPAEPSITIGLGMFSVDQSNEGYDWALFKERILFSVEVLKKSLSEKSESRPIMFELRYRDGLKMDNQSPFDFLNQTMRLKTKLAPEFLQHSGLESQILGAKINFGVISTTPKGLFTIDLTKGKMKGVNGPEDAIIMNTVIKSNCNDGISFDSEKLSEWINGAHNLQKHSFASIIEPNFAIKFN